MPQGGKAVTEPTATTQLILAITPTPQADAAQFPVLTPTPAPTGTIAPTAAPLPVEELSGYMILIDGQDHEMKLYQQGNVVYLPVLQLLKEAGVNVISSTSVEMDEYAFAVGLNLIRFTHTENQQGEPVDLQVYCNDIPQLVPERSLYRADQVLYMPAESIASMTGFSCTVDAAQQQIVINTVAE